MFIILKIFFAKRAVLKIGGCSRISPSHVTCLDQSRASEKGKLMDNNGEYSLRLWRKIVNYNPSNIFFNMQLV